MATASLIISHSIFLNEEERYNLSVDCKSIEKIGVFTPVWMNRDVTTEPAAEFFCKYEITNENDNKSEVKRIKKGFAVNLPQIPKEYVERELSNESWRKMSPKEKSDWYDNNPIPLSGKNLLNIKDGGGKYLSFKHIVKTQNDKGDAIYLIHSIKINSK